MTPKKRAAYERSENRGCIGVLLLLLLFGGYLAFGGLAGDDGKSETTAAREESTESGEDAPAAPSGASATREQKYSAFEICKEFVKDRLKSPGSAVFRNFFQDDGEVRVTGNGNGPYTVVSTVDSERLFGNSLQVRRGFPRFGLVDGISSIR